jgi:hypothetical protein
MAWFLTGDEKCRDLIYDDDFRSYLVSQNDSSPGYRFGRMHRNRVRIRARRTLRRVNGYLMDAIEAVANAKLRRLERRLKALRHS